MKRKEYEGQSRKLQVELCALQDWVKHARLRAWSWDRHAAVQLQHRYERISPARRMNGADWAAWEAVKAVTQAVMRTHSTAFDAVKAFLLSDVLTLDTEKGNPGSFRAWDHQLRAPVLLSRADAVIGTGSVAAILASDKCPRHARHRRARDSLPFLKSPCQL